MPSEIAKNIHGRNAQGYLISLKLKISPELHSRDEDQQVSEAICEALSSAQLNQSADLRVFFGVTVMMPSTCAAGFVEDEALAELVPSVSTSFAIGT